MQQHELGWNEGERLVRRPEAPDNQEPLRGEIAFASAEAQSQRIAELLGAGALVITLPPPAAQARGRLGEILEELVERELARMGAPSPYLAAWAAMPEDAQARLADQLFRARTVGATGLAIAMGSLRAIALPVLEPEDSATLRWLADVTADAPLVLLVDDADMGLFGYAAPVSLAELLAPRRATLPTVDAIVHASLERAETAATIEIEIDVEEPRSDEEPVVMLTGDDATTNDTRVASIADANLHADAEEPEPEAAPPPVAPTAPSRHRATAGIPLAGPGDAWRSWTIALSSARGAQPPAVFERLFVESYMPLANAVAAGLDDPRAVRAYDDFRRTFERSYTDAFAAFGATNRRPRLVMDAYDVANKQARLSSARAAHVLVVDAMRFDVGCMIRDALARETAGIATLTSETLLWSALPTTSARQLETLARGLDALREPGRDDPHPCESLRGRAAEVVRRLRAGSRELYKLDLVPAMLEGAHGDVLGALEDIAAHTAQAIARHVATLSPRTLLLVVGDHGFTFDRRGAVVTGGATPEEVLVPAFTWLIGDLH